MASQIFPMTRSMDLEASEPVHMDLHCQCWGAPTGSWGQCFEFEVLLGMAMSTNFGSLLESTMPLKGKHLGAEGGSLEDYTADAA